MKALVTQALTGIAGLTYVDVAEPMSSDAVIVGAQLGKSVAAGLRPRPPVRFALSDGAVALDALANGGMRGKLGLEP